MRFIELYSHAFIQQILIEVLLYVRLCGEMQS